MILIGLEAFTDDKLGGKGEFLSFGAWALMIESALD